MTDDEINQLIADCGNEAMEVIRRLSLPVIAMTAYGAGLQASILARRLRALNQAPEPSPTNKSTPEGGKAS